MTDQHRPQRGVVRKFAVAISGIAYAAKTDKSFFVHLPITALVIVIGLWLELEAWRWAVICLAIIVVMCAELFNTAIEVLVRAIHPDHDPRVGTVLDIAAGAVFIAALGAIVIGLLTLAVPLLQWWQA